MSRTIVPFGPQHPVLPEPIHLDLVLEDEKVVEAIPQIGFVHRGLEKLAEIRDYPEMLYVAERICGICSCIHGHGYCEAIEALMKIDVPARAKFLRVMYDEMSRIHSHLLWLGLVADSFGFESLFMHCWRIREKILDLVEELTGGRVIFGIHKIGGVRKDIAPGAVKDVVDRLKKIEKDCLTVTSIFKNDGSVKRRQCGIGILTKENAYVLGAVGPTLRGSGVNWDARKLGYSVYNELSWEPCVETAGDCYARTMVRIREVYSSFDMIYQAAGKLPDGPIETPVKGNPTGEYFARLEQPRGEVIYYIKGNGTKNLERFRVRTPTFANIPALVTMLQGEELPSVPVITLTIDPCISCTER